MGLPTLDWAKVVESEICDDVSLQFQIPVEPQAARTHRSNDSASGRVVRRASMHC